MDNTNTFCDLMGWTSEGEQDTPKKSSKSPSKNCKTDLEDLNSKVDFDDVETVYSDHDLGMCKFRCEQTLDLRKSIYNGSPNSESSVEYIHFKKDP